MPRPRKADQAGLLELTPAADETPPAQSSTKKILQSFLNLLETVEAEGESFQHEDIYFLYSLMEIPYGLWQIWLYEQSHETLSTRKQALLQVLEGIR